METANLTIKGQIVIPSKIRKKLGIKSGAKIGFIEKGDDVIIKPLDKGYYQSLIGIAGTKGKAMKSLMEDKEIEREL